MKINEIITEGKPGLWANIHAKRKRGAKMRKKGAPGAPTEKALKAAQAGSKNESVDQGVAEGLDKQQNYDLTPVYPNYKSLVGQCIGEKNDRYVFRIISAELKPGQGQTPQITYALANKTKISIEKSRSKNCKVVAEGNVEEALQAPPTSTGNSLLDEFIEMYVSKGWKYHGINKRGGHEFRKRQYMPAALYGLKDGGVIESFNNGTRVSIFDKSGKRVKKLADGPLSEQGVAEGSEQNVVKSVKVGNFRHDLVNTGMGWQVRIYNGDKLYDTGLSKNSEEKGLASLDDSVAYTKKQLNIKEQGVEEGWKQKVGAGLTAAALATGASGVVLNPARPIGPKGQTVANPYPNKASSVKSAEDDAWAKIEKRKAAEKKKPLEETYHDDDEFFEAYGVMEYNDEMINESEYQGRKVTLNKPMQGDVKKFKVYVKNPKGNVVKVNFGDPNSTIKKNNPARRKSFRARHNCDNPGPKTGARYWSCRKW
jgi:hypothetical protein